MPNSQTKLKTVTELAKKYVSLCDTIHDGEAYKEMEKSITQDRQHIERVLVEILAKISPTKEVMHDHIYIVEKSGKEIKEEAITLVKEVLQGK